MMRTSLLIEISVMGFFFGKILCGCHTVVFFENPVKIGYALETAGLADDRERIAPSFHLVYGMAETKLVDIFFYGKGFYLSDRPVYVTFRYTTGLGNIPDCLKCRIVRVNIMNDSLKTGCFILADGNLIFQRILMLENTQICKNLRK